MMIKVCLKREKVRFVGDALLLFYKKLKSNIKRKRLITAKKLVQKPQNYESRPNNYPFVLPHCSGCLPVLTS